MAKTLDGKKLSNKILDELKIEIKKLNKKIKLGIILVGENPESISYIERKKKIAKLLKIQIKIYKYPEAISTRKLRAEVVKIGKITTINGLIVQLPLPKNINTEAILNSIPTKKDIDVLNKESVGRLYKNKSNILPPTVAGIIKLLHEYKIKIKGNNIVIVGYGRLIGKPASIVLSHMNATVTVANEFTKNKKELLKKADIVISGVGKANIITKDMVKKGAVVIDAGISFQRGNLIGDVDKKVEKIAGYISPVPGGVGPMTVAMLFYNLIELYK